MARHHPASHAARKGIKGSPHTAGMPAGYLDGHSEDHLNAHNSHVGKLMRSHDHLSSEMGHSEPRTAMDGGSGKAAEDEVSEV